MNPQQFWTWFQNNEHKIYILPLLSKEEQRNYYYWFMKNLDYYCKGLGFKIHFANDYHGKATLTITAYGVKELYPKVIELVEAAPKINNWKFEAFIRQQEPKEDNHPYTFGNLEIDIKNLSFQPVKYIKSTGKLIIHIYFDKKFSTKNTQESDAVNTVNNKDLHTAINFILEDLLGEILLYAKIKKFKIYKNNRNRGITYKLSHLKTYLDLINQN